MTPSAVGQRSRPPRQGLFRLTISQSQALFPAGACVMPSRASDSTNSYHGKQSAGANGIDSLMAVACIHFFHDAAEVVLHREL